MTRQEEIAFQNGLLCGMAAKGGIAVPIKSGGGETKNSGIFKIEDMGYGGGISPIKCVVLKTKLYPCIQGAYVLEFKLPQYGQMESNLFQFERMDEE
ncbi:hypothetical protein [Acetivibrio ethanolgignens]|uniref:Uncharacterized protein n=1 Tax=Acetivibrio ethanolgignens TaxID=290052 RepID=A0A0V8QFA9_9FIRM|nr:hypothetical protein [Acetivibrio ethanolgignens]KSV59291.1 hypothetical protein ASU35_09450 [Acetivibrio ethanolgignens]